MDANDTNDCCCICLETLSSQSTMTLPACNHIFHTACFLSHLKTNPVHVACPICRHCVIEILRPPTTNATAATTILSPNIIIPTLQNHDRKQHNLFIGAGLTFLSVWLVMSMMSSSN